MKLLKENIVANNKAISFRQLHSSSTSRSSKPVAIMDMEDQCKGGIVFVQKEKDDHATGYPNKARELKKKEEESRSCKSNNSWLTVFYCFDRLYRYL
ncbi:hypothetical protein PVK06_040018 [Gossypium arboreum]|uniref:Uncharacterized protein n=1 Tax=Gossypium arboreum TaxID=29729 RepID=A0ABR0N4F8_GOSAR|nr:hypothetical protein PVK06_040018 [Gossypium arboreum]